MSEKQADKEYFPVPEWLNEQYVQNALRNYFNDQKLILDKLVVKPGSAVGENYGSVMLRLNVEFTNSKGKANKSTYLVKVSFESDDPDSQHSKPYNTYQREMDMYEFILPKMTKILHEINKKEKLNAETIYVDREHASIIFEDLTLSGYKTENRFERMDLERIKKCLQKIALFHATAAVLNEREPGMFAKNFDLGFFSRRTEGFKPIHIAMYEGLVRYVERTPELKEKYHKKLIAHMPNHMEYGARAFDVKEDSFMTLAHGDYWTNNIMVRFGEDVAQRSIIPIDYQYSAWCSPTIDLHYLLNSSLREDLRVESVMNELVQYYYYILADTLKKLKYKGRIPSLYKFHLEYQAHFYIAVFVTLIFQPQMVYNGKGISTHHNILSNSEYGIWLKDDYFNNVAVREYLPKMLSIFDAKGMFDPMD